MSSCIAITRRKSLKYLEKRPNTLIRTSSHRHRFFSSSSSQSQSQSSANRLGIGGTKSGKANPSQYANVIEKALKEGVTTFESVNGSEKTLTQAFTLAMMNLQHHIIDKPIHEKDITLTTRFGYRSEVLEENTNKSNGSLSFQGDVKLMNDFNTSSSNSGGTRGGLEQAYHNISPEYLEYFMEDNALIKLKRGEWGQNNHETKNLNLILMAHNPEVQASELLLSSNNNSGIPLPEIRQLVKEKMVESFQGLEEVCSNRSISSYGVVSNGLSLPESHPLHLSWSDVVHAACEAANIYHGKPTIPKLSTLQLPANLLETNGIKVAQNIHSFFSSPDQICREDHKDILVPSKMDIYISRPLTCYPDQGVGTGFPFKLIDYSIQNNNITENNPKNKNNQNNMEWTHKIKSDTPSQYTPTLNMAMSHFDAEHLLEIQSERPLTAEETETLEGCRLLRSMLQDLDSSLEKVRSFEQYEEDIYTQIIPLIHETFEELDEESASVLQAFFAAHGQATRLAIARTTRNLLKNGGEQGGGGEVETAYKDIPDDLTLQQFATQFLLKEKAVTKVIVGCLKPDHVTSAVEVVKLIDNNDEETE